VRLRAGQVHLAGDPMGGTVEPQFERFGALRRDLDGVIGHAIGLPVADIGTRRRPAGRPKEGIGRAIGLLDAGGRRFLALFDPHLAAGVGAPGILAVPALRAGCGTQHVFLHHPHMTQVGQPIIGTVEAARCQLSSIVQGLELVPRGTTGGLLGRRQQLVGFDRRIVGRHRCRRRGKRETGECRHHLGYELHATPSRPKPMPGLCPA
jgi:hypothetical protein